MSTDPQSLLNIAKCFSCYDPASPGESMELALLVQLVQQLNPTAKTDPATLLAAGNCYLCFGATGQTQIMKLGLLALLVNSGFGGVSVFDSGQIAMRSSAGLILNTAHGLSRSPDLIRITLECVSNDAVTGYQAGDVLDQTLILNSPAEAYSTATQIVAGTNALWAGNEAAINIIARNLTTGSQPTSMNNFKYRVKAYVL